MLATSCFPSMIASWKYRRAQSRAVFNVAVLIHIPPPIPRVLGDAVIREFAVLERDHPADLEAAALEAGRHIHAGMLQGVSPHGIRLELPLHVGQAGKFQPLAVVLGNQMPMRPRCLLPLSVRRPEVKPVIRASASW